MDFPEPLDANRVWFRLIRLHGIMSAAFSKRLREINLSIPQCDVLTTLMEREGVSQQDLAERLYVTKGNISGLIDRLATAGLMERRTLNGDRRTHAIHLTPEGRRLGQLGLATQRGAARANGCALRPDKRNPAQKRSRHVRGSIRSMTRARHPWRQH